MTRKSCPFTIPEWEAFPLQRKLLDEIRRHEYQIQDWLAVDPAKVESIRILNACRSRKNQMIRIFYEVRYDLTKEPFKSIGNLVFTDVH